MPSDARTVAIVEDDDLVRHATVSLIASLGLTALPYPSALAFLDAPEQSLGCILSDIHMPSMSGLELQDRLRERRSTVPLVLMTAYPTERIKAQALHNGAHRFLQKPYDADALVDCLADIFGPFDD